AGKMAAQVTHEIRNPLSSLGLNADLLEEELSGSEAPEPAEARGLLRAIQEEIERLTDITESYLRFARLPAPSLETTNLNEVVEDAVGFMRPEIEARDLRLEISLGSGLESIPIDAGQIRRALINLLRNSTEALGDSGEIRVDTMREGEETRLSVSDDGPGVPEQNREQIFETFYSTKSSGTGLGLPMVRQIALAHGGDVHYEKNESAGRGSRFVIVLPTKLSEPGEEGDDGEKKES
ncbi:MAG: ATP-binding protein, partial [Polyangia bacterium]